MGKKIGVDLGGSWVRVGVLDADGSLRVDKHASPGGWEHFAAILAPYSAANVDGFGVAIAGPIQDHAVVVKGPNLHWLDGRDVHRDLEAVLRKRVVVSNDMEAATEGEWARGVLRNYRWAIFDTISTGWGGNLLLDGRRVDGEPGHVNVRFDKRYRCGCGNYGCNEALYSGSSMQRRIREHLPARRRCRRVDAVPRRRRRGDDMGCGIARRVGRGRRPRVGQRAQSHTADAGGRVHGHHGGEPDRPAARGPPAPRDGSVHRPISRAQGGVVSDSSGPGAQPLDLWGDCGV